ncbi:MAG: glutamine synthetase III [Synergistaceae bacterium]|nr:glutamine synthetase III [Synergistaceae bacterium]MBR0094070.1 glutamine synthetase III [Synergistaceae bacterium]
MSEREYKTVHEIFGSMVFDARVMREKLNSDIYEQVMAAMEGRQRLTPEAADIVAGAMKDWAISKGATHWAHWFQPQTELTAEKHQAFTLSDSNGNPIEVFRGHHLAQGEPDASSFPSAGTRSTFEARGYSAWDISSPAFIVKSPKGGTLCIPSVFLSYDGTPLDLKTPLLRSLDAVESRALKLLKTLGQRGVKSVKMTVGAEQEYFLLDRPRAQLRPDIRFCGRTLIGAQPAKDQKLDHHYFGAIPPRVLRYMEDVERDLARLGISVIARHNEVARCQFEFAHLYADANRACDQNQILMETMRKLARQHELRLLFHEKPFYGMNGSGKHTNMSLVDSEGRNLLKPSHSHRRNVIFLAFLSAVVLGVSKFHSLLQAAIATYGNLFRLGGHEAPPSIISVYLGSALTDLIKRLDSADVSLPEKGVMDLGLTKLPDIIPFDSDRNRTSPVAFTGDKFEFRAPGSSQSIALPVTMFASLWAWGIDEVTRMVEERVTSGKEPIDAALEAAREAFRRGSNILFEGDAYTSEWHDEARKRGLIEAETMPDRIDLLLKPENKAMLEALGVYKAHELENLHEVRMESFATGLEVEAAVLYDMLWEGVLPALSKQLILEKNSLSSLDGVDFGDCTPWRDYVGGLGRAKNALIKDAANLFELKGRLSGMNARERSDLLTGEIIPLMDSIRTKCDAAELTIAADIWPYPIYRNLLSLSA